MPYTAGKNRGSGSAGVFYVLFLLAISVPWRDILTTGFLPMAGTTCRYTQQRQWGERLYFIILAGTDTNEVSTTPEVSQRTTSFELVLSEERTQQFRSLSASRASSLRKKLFFWRKSNKERKAKCDEEVVLNFTYDYDFLELSLSGIPAVTTGIVLIHPIGVGIAKWFYQRLIASLTTSYPSTAAEKQRFVVVVPDLLGSGTACNATIDKDATEIITFPLFNISDWANQIVDLMSTVEAEEKSYSNLPIDRWCVVANGGCSPIALQVAERSLKGRMPNYEGRTLQNVSNVILSSVPRLPFFLPANVSDPVRVERSYRTLCGIAGKIFWWYACRNDGSFIQKFSEKNLVADPKNLGDQWRSNCCNTAKMSGGKSRYSTFSFLAGTLQDGCRSSLQALHGSSVCIDVIKGADVRRNRARSWFWKQKRMQSKGTISEELKKKKTYETFRDYVVRNGNRGNEAVIGGRISLAHEDSEGYAKSILYFLN